MKALKVIVIILVVIIAIILIPPIFMPSEMHVKETRVLKAQPEVIWDQVNCLENWENWDIWHQDTNIKGRYEGPECGVGAKNIWKYKNRDDGGSQAIVESREYEYIKTFLDFRKMGTAEAEFYFENVDNGTKVTWTLNSESPYPIGRWISTLFIKPGLTKSYQDGLKNLDELTKDMKPKPKYSTGEIEIKEVAPLNAIAIRVTTDVEGISDAMGASFGKLIQFIGKKNVQIAGAPRAIYYSWEKQFEFDNAIPVAKAIKGEGDIRAIKTYGGKTVHATHRGSYQSTQYSWAALDDYIKSNGLETNGNPYEVYITDPQSEPDPSKWVTELYWPVK